MANELVINPFAANDFERALKIAEKIAKSDLAPKDYKGKPENVFIAMQFGYETGLNPMQAIQNIAVINGRPCIWGDAMLAIAQSNPDFEWIDEKPIKNGTTVVGYKCIVKRRNYPEREATFTMEDAKKAGLWGKSGPWSSYPERMMQMRARGFAIRDTFADALKGLGSAEEVQDYDQPVVKMRSHRQPLKRVVEETTSLPKIEEPLTIKDEDITIGMKALPSASSEQLNELVSLINVTSTPKETVDAWIKHAGVNDIGEMDSEKAKKCIDFLRKKVEFNKESVA
jgi:hypothetical protein